jgi:hypothetical protein
MNLWLFKRISVARVSGENISNSWQACNRSPAQTCNFWAPSSSNTRSNWHIDIITSSALFLKQTLHYHTSELRTELTNSYNLKQQQKVHDRVEISSFGKTIYFFYKQSNKCFRTTGKGTLGMLELLSWKKERSMWKQITWTEFLRYTELQYLYKVHTSYSCKIFFNNIHPILIFLVARVSPQ